MFYLLEVENEENVLVCLRIIIELHKQFRPSISPEVKRVHVRVHVKALRFNNLNVCNIISCVLVCVLHVYILFTFCRLTDSCNL